MTEQKPTPAPLHPIQVVSRRTGLSPDVLRAWERRYKAITPSRSRGSRRLYTDDDVDRLILLRKATLAGRSISQVAGMPTGELAALVSADDEKAQEAPAGTTRQRAVPAGPMEPAGHLEECLSAVREFDSAGLQLAISRASVALPRAALMRQVLMPLMRRIGDAWRAGTLRIAHEHLATAAVRAELGLFMTSQAPAPGAPCLVVATPSGQAHELGAMVAAVTAATQGWRTSYLGANLPAEEIAAAARQSGACAVALSIVHPPDDPRLHEELRRLRRHLPQDAAIITGGAAAPAYESACKAIDAIRLEDMQDLAETLEILRLAP